MDIVDVNKDFYNKLYRRRNPVISILHSLISFDQQSKSKINIGVVRKQLGKRFFNTLSVLDYGFGHGSLLLKYRRNHVLYGCDISVEATENFPRVAALVGKKVRTATVEDFFVNFSGIKFDIITLSHIIEHVDDDVELVTRLSGTLSKTGIMLINVPLNEVWEDPKHVRKYTATYMKGILDRCNLQVLSILEADKLTSYFLIEEKVKKATKLKLIGIKMARAFFALMPLMVTRGFEQILLKDHNNQQLIVVASQK